MAGIIMISPAAARVNAELTQREVAEKMGVSVQTVVNWESGKTVPNIEVARKLSLLYKMPLDSIDFLRPSTQI